MPSSSKARILIVDDHAETRNALIELLQDDFDIVGERPNAVGLKEAVRECRPDVVLLDISMPKINGLTAARRLRQAGVDVKIIFVTEHADPQYINEGFRAGGSGFVVKSHAPSQIRPAIFQVIRGGRFPPDEDAAVDPSVSDSSAFRS